MQRLKQLNAVLESVQTHGLDWNLESESLLSQWLSHVVAQYLVLKGGSASRCRLSEDSLLI